MKIENEDVNTGCTIIIPTYNRPQYLQRILGYYDSFGEKFKIIVADSSSDENKKLNKKIISSVSNLDIKHLDHYPTEINSHHKFADMVNYVEEKYCVFCADDDFIVPNGIKQSVVFLKKNPDFTVAQGYHIVFHLKPGKNGEQQFYWTPNYSQDSIIFPDAKSRLTEHLSNYTLPTIYAVHRTDFLKMVYQELLNSDVDPMQFGELLPTMLTLIYGQMKWIDVPYAARQAESRVGYWPSLSEYIKAGKYENEYIKFKNCLAFHLSKNSQLDINASKKMVDKAMAAYMKKNYPNNLLIHKMRVILGYLRLPDWIDEGIRTLYRKLIFQKRIRKQMDNFQCFEDVFPPKYCEDFNKIRRHALFYSKNDKR